MKLVPIYNIRIVYKSGYTHDIEVYSFSITDDRYEWTSVSESNKPIILGVGEIAAIYQIGVRHKVSFK